MLTIIYMTLTYWSSVDVDVKVLYAVFDVRVLTFVGKIAIKVKAFYWTGKRWQTYTKGPHVLTTVFWHIQMKVLSP
jgi:hypothetical protein